MPLYAIFRQFPGELSEEESGAVAFRAITGQPYYPGVAWDRTYSHTESPGSLCIYAGDSAADVAGHSTYCGIPFSEVREVELFLPEDFMAPEHNLAPSNGRLYVIQRTMPSDTTRAEVEAAALMSATCLSGYPTIRWERSFWDQERVRSHCVYLATSPEEIRRHAASAHIPCDTITPVEEVLPAQFEHVYDSYGIDKSWLSPAVVS